MILLHCGALLEVAAAAAQALLLTSYDCGNFSKLHTMEEWHEICLHATQDDGKLGEAINSGLTMCRRVARYVSGYTICARRRMLQCSKCNRIKKPFQKHHLETYIRSHPKFDCTSSRLQSHIFAVRYYILGYILL